MSRVKLCPFKDFSFASQLVIEGVESNRGWATAHGARFPTTVTQQPGSCYQLLTMEATSVQNSQVLEYVITGLQMEVARSISYSCSNVSDNYRYMPQFKCCTRLDLSANASLYRRSSQSNHGLHPYTRTGLSCSSKTMSVGNVFMLCLLYH